MFPALSNNWDLSTSSYFASGQQINFDLINTHIYGDMLFRRTLNFIIQIIQMKSLGAKQVNNLEKIELLAFIQV